MHAIELQWKENNIIKIGEDLIKNTGKIILPYIKSHRVFIITDKNVELYHLKTLQSSLASESIVSVVHIIEAGEGSKNFRTLQKLLEETLGSGIDSNGTIIALGGGVVGDIAALAANLLLRGVSLIHIPTSLIAQVDSAIGGKTAINSQYGKNLIGTMYDAKLTLIDVNLLKTLPDEEFIAGYAEVVKYALLYSNTFFSWLEENLEQILQKDQLLYLVKTCCQMKLMAVANDIYDQKRNMLNFGHSIAHAIEASSGYKVRHGYAVAVGLVIESAISGIDNTPIVDHLKRAGLPVSLEDLNLQTDDLYEFLTRDKKTKNKTILIILLEKIGKAYTEYVSCDFMCNIIYSK